MTSDLILVLASSFQDYHVQQIIKGVCLNKIIYSSKAALDQLMEGLSSHKVKEMIAGNFSLAKAVFTHSPTAAIDVSTVRSLFKAIPSSPQGSNARSREEEIMMHWYRFLSDVEEGLISVGMS